MKLKDLRDRFGKNFNIEETAIIESVNYSEAFDRATVIIEGVSQEDSMKEVDEFFHEILSTISEIEVKFNGVLEKSEQSVDICKECVSFLEDKGFSKEELKVFCINETLQINLLQKNLEVDLDDLKTNVEGFIKEFNSEIKSISIIHICEEDSTQSYIEDLKNKEKSLAQNAIKTIGKIENKKSNEQNGKKERFGRKIKTDITSISDLGDNWDFVCIAGEVISCDKIITKSEEYIILNYDIYDNSSTITCKTFFKSNKFDEYSELIQPGKCVKVEGKYTYDNFSRCNIINVSSIEPYHLNKRLDKADTKRVELHMYTQFSAIDGFIKIEDMIKQLDSWGYEAVGITDKGVAQGYPDVFDNAKDSNIRPLYGLEAKILKDKLRILTDFYEEFNDNNFVVFDIETTGFSKLNDKIIEIGAVKVENGKIVKTYNQLINPKQSLPQKIVELTNITDGMLMGQPEIDQVLPEFMEFVGDSTLVAHNAEFDIGFIRENCKRENIEFKNAYIDTLALCRACYPDLKNHKLDTISKHLGVSLESHHRACDDAMATAHIFIKALNEEPVLELSSLNDLNKVETTWPKYKNEEYNCIIYATNIVGLKNLYKLISISSMNYFNRSPGIPESLLEEHKEGLIIGSGNYKGELYQSIISGYPDFHTEEILKKFDFIEVQPPLNYKPLVDDGKILSMDEVINNIYKIIKMADENDKIVVATSDCHYFDPKDYILRNIVQMAQPFVRRDSIEKYPTLYFRTTEEMLKEFNFMDSGLARKIVIDNTHKVKDMIEEFDPIPQGTFPPFIEGSAENLRELTYAKATSMYGDPLPEYVKTRLDRELNSIISNGYAVLYIIARKLVIKSNEDGYVVGSRGSVGSSFAATMADITEVNPLLPHYRCPECKYSKFIDDMNVGSGVDLPEMDCPSCGTKMIRDGHNIPFEVFLGFEGDKEPDIDLNFAGEYQPICHKYTEELFGEDKVFRAGTIGTIAENTAYGYISKFMEITDEDFPEAEIKRLQKKMVGIKRTSGQHPGGVMIVPKEKEIYDFCPVQHPADDMNSNIITTHFDYNAISGKILKLDLLGHDVPSIIRHLHDLTGINPLTVPFGDEETMRLFSSTDSLNFVKPYETSSVGTLGIPEFGTGFVRQMLVETKPTNMAELFRISGLSHGTDVWINNAQDLVNNGITTLKNVISTRDDIMTYLIQMGLDKKKSFTIMERVRKGKPLSEETEDYMRSFNVPEWYIESCRKIKYMFPKAHAVAYVLMSYRIAYFKVHHPEAFYCTYFTTKNSAFPGQIIYGGLESVREEMERIKKLGFSASVKEKNILNVLELAEEMYCRGIELEPVTFGKSKDIQFTYDKKGSIIPPYRALEGVSDAHSISIYNEYKNGEFISIQDLINRTGINKVAVQALKEHGTLFGMSESNQISLF